MIDIKRKLDRLVAKLQGREKQFAEELFWRREIEKYVRWYKGKDWLYDQRPPMQHERVHASTLELSAILTFFHEMQLKKYPKYLKMDELALRGKRVLDVGSGPFPNALCFEDADVYSMDELVDRFVAAGFPLHTYEKRNRWVAAPAEKMPFSNNFFDMVLSVNAIDHVGDFGKVASEVRRVLHPEGRVRLHVHYHQPTVAEPHVLNDQTMLHYYGWLPGFTKLHWYTAPDGTTHTLWGN